MYHLHHFAKCYFYESFFVIYRRLPLYTYFFVELSFYEMLEAGILMMPFIPK
jgi:hypothetical protein